MATGSVEFDGDLGQHLEDTSPPVSNERAFSMCAWFYFIAGAGAGESSVIALGGGGNAHILNVDDGTSNFEVTTSAGPTTILSSIPANTWHFGALVSNGGGPNGIAGYGAVLTAASITKVNKSQEGNYTPSLFEVNGDGAGAGWHGDMRIAAVKVWDVVLSDEEIENERWFYGPQSQIPNLVYWNPLVNAGMTTVDFSGNGNALAQVGGAPVVAEGPPAHWNTIEPLVLADAAVVAVLGIESFYAPPPVHIFVPASIDV